MEYVARQYPVAARVGHVHVQIVASHGYDDVNINLEVVRNALLDTEGVSRSALPPPPELGGGEP